METIRVSRHAGGGVAEITLNRSEAMNAISTAMAGELARACAEIAARPEVRVVVFSAAGERAFCAGAARRPGRASSRGRGSAAQPARRES